MSVEVYSELTINGYPVPVSKITFNDSYRPGHRRSTALGPIFATFDAQLTLSSAQLELFLSTMFPPSSDAAPHVLARRIEYGGRKGRAAWRRLSRMGFVGTMRINEERPVPLPPLTVKYR